MRHPAGTALHRYRFLGHQASGRMTMSDSNNAARRGDAGLAFIFGGIVVGLAIIAFVVFSNGGIGTPDGPEVSVDIDLPMPHDKVDVGLIAPAVWSKAAE
jgi:hypothetical protein